MGIDQNIEALLTGTFDRRSYWIPHIPVQSVDGVIRLPTVPESGGKCYGMDFIFTIRTLPVVEAVRPLLPNMDDRHDLYL